MKRADLDAWLADLRANPDKQGKNYLSKGDKQCCLGRLCLLTNVVVTDRTTVARADLFDFGEDHPERWCAAMPPRWWCEEKGIPFATAQKVADMNDNGYTFAQIADWLEANVPVED